ncbi:MAG: TetR/AcrR family transcriptional regulator [Pseudomonadota bacterium]
MALRGRLLDAAVARFAHQGIAGSALREIAADAGATPALVHYYFGNRDALLAAVIEERIVPVMQRLRGAVAEAGDDPRALVRGFVRAVLAVAMAQPWLPQLWVREILHEGGALRGLLREQFAGLPRTLAERFARAQAAGRLNPHLDPRLLVPSLIGQTMFMAASAPIWRGLLDADDVDADALSAHVLALLEHGLQLRRQESNDA